MTVQITTQRCGLCGVPGWDVVKHHGIVHVEVFRFGAELTDAHIAEGQRELDIAMQAIAESRGANWITDFDLSLDPFAVVDQNKGLRLIGNGVACLMRER